MPRAMPRQTRSSTESPTRRDMFRAGAAAAGVWAMARWPAAAVSEVRLAEPAADEEVVPFVQAIPDANGTRVSFDNLEASKDWITPNERVFVVGHYAKPTVDVEKYKLRVTGRVDRPKTLTLDEIRSRPQKEVTATLECSGNGSGPAFLSAVGNVKWLGTPLAPLLRECGVQDGSVEVAFWGADTGKEKIRNNDVEQNFARTLLMKDGLRDDLLLCYEMNGQPLPAGHGGPLRLVVPGWYGIAWVKWLQQVEVRDRRLMSRFVARDYVTLRGEEKNGTVVWKESSVGPMNVKSIVARVTRRKGDNGSGGPLRVTAVAWTQGRVKSVELKIDDGPWTPAKLDESHQDPHTWTFWSYEWKDAKPGEHTLVSRATDEQGRAQPTADDPEIRLKKTYWEAYAQYPRKIRIEA